MNLLHDQYKLDWSENERLFKLFPAKRFRKCFYVWYGLLEYLNYI